jgi:hypothetical protein
MIKLTINSFKANEGQTPAKYAFKAGGGYVKGVAYGHKKQSKRHEH